MEFLQRCNCNSSQYHAGSTVDLLLLQHYRNNAPRVLRSSLYLGLRRKQLQSVVTLDMTWGKAARNHFKIDGNLSEVGIVPWSGSLVFGRCSNFPVSTIFAISQKLFDMKLLKNSLSNNYLK